MATVHLIQQGKGGVGKSMVTPEGGYDPAAVKGKEAFFDRAIPALGRQDGGQPLELKAGGVIPAALVTGINSELPGQISAQVTQNVYDTARGRHLLIPQGAKLTEKWSPLFGQKTWVS